jgi:hypothetical protein
VTRTTVIDQASVPSIASPLQIHRELPAMSVRRGDISDILCHFRR